MALPPDVAERLEALLEYLKRGRGFDFTGYKRSSLQRRLARRMEAVGCDTYDRYQDFLEVHPEEFATLFNTILINVTAFFRDPEAWTHVADDVLPRILEGKGPGAPIRVWSAGCSSGEETYTLAMLLAERLGAEEFLRRVKIYATDVDEEALEIARHGTYGADAVEPIPGALLDRYFERSDSRWTFRKDLRRNIIFGRNDLVQDAPISRIDLLACRNALIYFNAETQGRILSRFHFALDPAGFLFMGRSEMLITHSDLFVPHDLKRRTFRRVTRPAMRDRLPHIQRGDGGRPGAPVIPPNVLTRAFEAVPVAQLIVRADGVLLEANERARALLGLAPVDVGRPLDELELSHRPVDLRAQLERAFASSRRMTLEQVAHHLPGGEPRVLDVSISPLVDGHEVVAANVVFVDVTAHHRLRADLAASKGALENAYEELQSTVEELETTNEELQSTNEELETMNEELQSTNEELETTNDELRERTSELNGANLFLEVVLTTLGVGVVMVDPQLTVRAWNAHATELWGLRPEEAEGQHVLALDVGLPVEQLKQPLRAALDGTHRADLVLEATNRRGRSFRCAVTLVEMRAGEAPPTGVILLMRREGEDAGAPRPAA